MITLIILVLLLGGVSAKYRNDKRLVDAFVDQFSRGGFEPHCQLTVVKVCRQFCTRICIDICKYVLKDICT